MANKNRLDTVAVQDPDGEKWHKKAASEWERASSPRARKELQLPPLPEWKASEYVTRELYGRFIQDRDTGIVHDVSAATEDCKVDAIVNGTFFHFWSEVLENLDVEEDKPCQHCLKV